MKKQESQERVTEYPEYHPYRHHWISRVDYITAKNARGRAIEVKRVEKCEHCPYEKVTRIDTNAWDAWAVKGKPYYRRPKNAHVVRTSRAVYLRDQFMQTTDIPESTFRR